MGKGEFYVGSDTGPRYITQSYKSIELDLTKTKFSFSHMMTPQEIHVLQELPWQLTKLSKLPLCLFLPSLPAGDLLRDL